MGRDYHVTGGHEVEAEAAQRAKTPTRPGLWILRMLGYQGSPGNPPKAKRPAPVTSIRTSDEKAEHGLDSLSPGRRTGAVCDDLALANPLMQPAP
jgi:hypothetical protein